jgi:hypothetical protein
VLEQGNGGGCNTILEFSAAAEENRQAVWGHDWPVFFYLESFNKKKSPITLLDGSNWLGTERISIKFS